VARRPVMICRCLVLLTITPLLCLAAAPTAAQDLPYSVDARSVSLSESLPDGAAIGRLRPRGMLELPSFVVGKMRFSQLSGLAWDDDEGILYAISDKGYLFHLKPVFQDDTLVDITVLHAALLTDLNGKPLKALWRDSEGLEAINARNGIKGDTELLVSFERFPRIVRYRPDGKALGELTLPATLSNRNAYNDPNEMLESVCMDPRLGVLTTPEMPLKGEPAGSTRIFSLASKEWRYPITRGFGISALECLGDTRVLVLERNFGHLFGRNAVSLKLVTLPVRPSANEPLTPTEVATLDMSLGHQIDNFEGLARHKGNRFFMISDDNDLFIERTLLLYFELLPEPEKN